MCAMETQRQAPVGGAAMTAQPMSDGALLRGIAIERLTSRVRCASVAGTKKLPNTDVKKGMSRLALGVL